MFVEAITNLSFYCCHFEWTKIWHAEVSWPLSELIRFWSLFVDFPHFGIILTQWSRPKRHLPYIFLIMQGRGGLKIGMLMYPDDLQSLSDSDDGLFHYAWEEWFKIWLADVFWLLLFCWFSPDTLQNHDKSTACTYFLLTSKYDNVHLHRQLGKPLVMNGIWCHKTLFFVIEAARNVPSKITVNNPI